MLDGGKFRALVAVAFRSDEFTWRKRSNAITSAHDEAGEECFHDRQRDMQPIAWEGGQMARTRFDKTFTGELVGKSVIEAIMLRTDNDGPAVLFGCREVRLYPERPQGHVPAAARCDDARLHNDSSWKIVSGWGTGELVGIRGEGEILPNHDFILAYELES